MENRSRLKDEGLREREREGEGHRFCVELSFDKLAEM